MKEKINLIEWLRGKKSLCLNDYGDIEIDAEFIQKNAKRDLLMIGMIRKTGSEIAMFDEKNLSNLIRVFYNWGNQVIYYVMNISDVSDNGVYGYVTKYRPKNKFILNLIQRYENEKNKSSYHEATW